MKEDTSILKSKDLNSQTEEDAMKVRLSYEGEMYQDDEAIKIIVHAADMHSAIWDARQEIRSRLKHYDGPMSDEEVRFLEQLQDTLWVEGIGL